MDFTPELSAIQGVISSEDQFYTLSRLTCKGGNEENINHVADSVRKFLIDGKYINDDGVLDVNKTRKFALYLVLNTDFKILESMVEIEGISIVVWSTPTIPKHLMCELLWRLHMNEFISEIITYCYPPLAVSVAGAFADHLKYFDPITSLDKLHKLTASCYALICRMHCFKLTQNDSKDLPNTVFETFKKLLKYFVHPPNAHKLDLVKEDEVYKFKGESLKTMLYLIYNCFNIFTGDVNSTFFHDVYKATFTEDSIQDGLPFTKVCEVTGATVTQFLNNCNNLLLDAFMEMVMGISVDIFCAWSEFETEGKTMQQIIGELCYKVRIKLLNVSSVAEHAVVSMIQQMSRKPVVIKDIINSTDINVIIKNISSNNEESATWLHALLYKEDLWQHDDLIKLIDMNIEKFNGKECSRLYWSFTQAHKKINTVNKELVISVAIKLFQHCDIPVKLQLLIEHFGENLFFDLNKGEEFENTVTEMFNKFVSTSDADITDVLNVFYQNPRQVYKKIFDLAKENRQLTSILSVIMELLKSYSNHYYKSDAEPCLINTIKKLFDGKELDTELKQENIVSFLTELKKNESIPEPKLLLLIIMPTVHKALLSKHIVMLRVQIQLLGKAYSVTELLRYRAPMLVMLAQVLEVVRWKNITTFDPIAPATLQLTIELQKALMATYGNTMPVGDRQWLSHRLDPGMHPTNKIYYRQVWDDYKERDPKFYQGLSLQPSPLDFRNRNLITGWVLQVLLMAAQNEWYQVWDDLAADLKENQVMCIFNMAFKQMLDTVEKVRTPQSRACLLYCYQNLLLLIKNKYLMEPLTDPKVSIVAHGLGVLLRVTNAADVEDFSSLLLPLIAFLADKKHNFTIDVPSFFRNTSYFDLVQNAFYGTLG